MPWSFNDARFYGLHHLMWSGVTATTTMRLICLLALHALETVLFALEFRHEISRSPYPFSVSIVSPWNHRRRDSYLIDQLDLLIQIQCFGCFSPLKRTQVILLTARILIDWNYSLCIDTKHRNNEIFVEKENIDELISALMMNSQGIVDFNNLFYSAILRWKTCRKQMEEKSLACLGTFSKGASLKQLNRTVTEMSFLFCSTEADCCVGEAAGEACWEPCYCVLLQDEQTLTAYRSEDMAVSRLSIFCSISSQAYGNNLTITKLDTSGLSSFHSIYYK